MILQTYYMLALIIGVTMVCLKISDNSIRKMFSTIKLLDTKAIDTKTVRVTTETFCLSVYLSVTNQRSLLCKTWIVQTEMSPSPNAPSGGDFGPPM